tara:strand:- start:3716 stop:4396 length:681 start_codon:yes stop_codon:yes gene_type:complete
MTIAYIRVSTDEQASDGFSLGNQRSRIMQYCDFNKLPVPLIFSDEGISGKKQKNRDGFKAMAQFANDNPVENIIIYSLSRLGRNAVETLQFIDEMTRLGIGVHSLSEKLDTNSAMGRFFLTVLSALCELESGQLGERVSSVLQNKKSSGEQYCKKISGFDVVGGKLIPNEFMKTIQSMVRWAGEGSSDTEIARKLDYFNIRTVNGKKFRHSGVRKILNNEIYKSYL